MKSLVRLLFLTVALASALAAAPATKKVLFFTKSSGFEHDVIKTLDGPRYGAAFRVLRELGAQHNIEFVFSKDGSLFSKDYLAQFDAFFFATSGDLTLAKNNPAQGDGNPPMTPAGKQALLDAIAGGKGFVGTHNASDTFHAPGNQDHGPARNEPDGANTDPYGKMLGASFIKHDAQQPARMIIADAKFPGMAAVPADFVLHEEWYSLKNFAPDLHVLMVQDTSTMTGPSYARPNYPATWVRLHGQGRVFYTNMGHRDDVWANPIFQSVLMGGLNWALRRVEADVTPNIATVAPQAGVLPKYVAPPPPKQKQAAKKK
ncbi:MAG: ThuA domain-containing protein [Opitutaceae bacterium]|nr:ThuA domain-containing protein [Opitutaceae bacterium]